MAIKQHKDQKNHSYSQQTLAIKSKLEKQITHILGGEVISALVLAGLEVDRDKLHLHVLLICVGKHPFGAGGHGDIVKFQCHCSCWKYIKFRGSLEIAHELDDNLKHQERHRSNYLVLKELEACYGGHFLQNNIVRRVLMVI